MDGRELKRLYAAVSTAASLVKLVCGVANNAAWLVCLEAHDRMKGHYRYNAMVIGGHTVGWAYLRALKMYQQYERRLLYATENRMFCVADMSPEVRKRYWDGLTDQQYYEFWTGLGADAYKRTRPMITSLQNKYRLSLLNHGIKDADILAWAMVAQACLELAVKMYESAITNTAKEHGVRKDIMERIFGQFSLKEIARVWGRALGDTEPATGGYELEHTEERNIEVGLEQLEEAWSNPTTLYKATIESVDDYAEIFASRMEAKVAKAEIDAAERKTREEMEG